MHFWVFQSSSSNIQITQKENQLNFNGCKEVEKETESLFSFVVKRKVTSTFESLKVFPSFCLCLRFTPEDK